MLKMIFRRRYHVKSRERQYVHAVRNRFDHDIRTTCGTDSLLSVLVHCRWW